LELQATSSGSRFIEDVPPFVDALAPFFLFLGRQVNKLLA
jgi:hypothetical protein